MDLTLNEQQQQIVDAVDRVIERNDEHRPAMKLIEEGKYDETLHNTLQESGFLLVALEEDLGPLEAALVVDAVCRGGGLVAAGATAIVFPMVTGEVAPGPVALAGNRGEHPFRFAQHASTILIEDGDKVLRLDTTPDDVELVDNDRCGFPLGRLKSNALGRAKAIDAPADRLRDWWRTALAVETAGTMHGAFKTTLQYVKDREQFNRPIGSYQALQHRLAQLTVQIEGARWLGFQAAYKNAEPSHAATAVTYAIGTAPLAFKETQQMHGAIGFTREYHLHVWSMRLPTLQRELGGAMQHARSLTQLRFLAEGSQPAATANVPASAI